SPPCACTRWKWTTSTTWRCSWWAPTRRPSATSTTCSATPTWPACASTATAASISSTKCRATPSPMCSAMWSTSPTTSSAASATPPRTRCARAGSRWRSASRCSAPSPRASGATPTSSADTPGRTADDASLFGPTGSGCRAEKAQPSSANRGQRRATADDASLFGPTGSGCRAEKAQPSSANRGQRRATADDASLFGPTGSDCRAEKAQPSSANKIRQKTRTPADLGTRQPNAIPCPHGQRLKHRRSGTMAKVIIIGAGGVGGVVAHKCAQLPEVFSDILLASRTESKCKAIAADIERMQGRAIRTAQVDADNVPELAALLKAEQPKLVINVALPYQDLTIMDACLEAGVDYLDTANYEPLDTAKFEYSWQWAYRQRFEKAGLMALLGSGFDPGATNVFTAWIAKHYFDEIHTLDIIDVNGGNHGYPFATNFNPEINIREVTANCRHWENGEFVTTPPMSTKMEFTCPEGVGTYNMYRLYHEELESLV